MASHHKRAACYIGICLVAPLACGLPLILASRALGFIVGFPLLQFLFLAALVCSTPVVWVIGPMILWWFHESRVDGAGAHALAGAIVGSATALILMLAGGGSAATILLALCVGAIQGLAVGMTIYALRVNAPRLLS